MSTGPGNGAEDRDEYMTNDTIANGNLHKVTDGSFDSSPDSNRLSGALPASDESGQSPGFFKGRKIGGSFIGAALNSLNLGRRNSIEKRGSDTAGDAAIVEKLSNIPIHVRGRAEAWEIPRSQLQLSTRLGAGAGSVVFKCRWRGLDCAAKLLSERCAPDAGVYQEMVNEISIISHLRHPNLVLFLGACTVGAEPLVILSEYMAGGSLEDRFKAIAAGSAHKCAAAPRTPPRGGAGWDRGGGRAAPAPLPPNASRGESSPP